MNVETFLDYNGVLKVAFTITDTEQKYEYICNSGNYKLTNNVCSNLYRISDFKETEDPDILQLTINDTIFVNVSKSTGQIESVNKLTAFELRRLGQGRVERNSIFKRKFARFYK